MSGMNTELVIFPESPEAAWLENRQVRVSRDGSISLFESAARYHGATHIKCQCGKPASKRYTLCEDCREAAKIERYGKMPRVEWKGEYLYSDRYDRYYANFEEAADDIAEGATMEDLRLLICEPQHVRELDDDYFHDELPEDGYLPDEVEAAMKAFNAAVKNVVLSWTPMDKVPIIPAEYATRSKA